MDIHLRIVSAIIVLFVLIGLTLLLKKRGLVEEHHAKMFSKLITQVTLPALVFFSLARSEILLSEAGLALIMGFATFVCLLLGWLIARVMRMNGPQRGSVILVTGFGSSSLLGFALVSEVFPNHDQAIAEAIVLSALGVQPLMFTLGTLIAIYYGNSNTSTAVRLKSALEYFYSPIFIAFAGGILLSLFLGPAANPIYVSILDGVHVAAVANTFLVTLAVGLFLDFRRLREVLVVGALVCAVKLIFMPIIVRTPTFLMAFPAWQIEVLVLEAAMPSAMLAVVFASSYSCDARLACKLVLVTTLAAVLTIPVMFEVLT